MTDVVGGLVWLKNMDCAQLNADWGLASNRVANLGDGQCGLTDGSSAGDWRLPTQAEVEAFWAPGCARGGGQPSLTLADTAGTGCALDNGTPFTLIPLNRAAFMTSTIDSANIGNFIAMNFGNASMFPFGRGTSPSAAVWPVRAIGGGS